MISTLTFMTVTGTLVLFKLALMVLAVVLLTKTLFPGRNRLAPSPVPANQPPPSHRIAN